MVTYWCCCTGFDTNYIGAVGSVYSTNYIGAVGIEYNTNYIGVVGK